MAVDRLERGQQPLPPLAVEGADRSAQAIDRLTKLVAFGRVADARLLEFGKFALGDQVDRADPLALERRPLMVRGFGAGIADVVRREADAFGKQRRRTGEPLVGQPAHLVPA